MRQTGLILLLFTLLSVSACAQPVPAGGTTTAMKGVATESFLADIAQNIAGDRVVFSSLIPAGMDPHAFEPVPSDIAKVSQSVILVENGAGLEEWLQPLLENASGERVVVTAADGLVNRTPSTNEAGIGEAHPGIDPHFWLDPLLVISYVQNIRDGLIQADPEGAEYYQRRAEAYITQLEELDLWIQFQVKEIPLEKRWLVTNHETLGYFADRYGFTILGTVIPATTTGVSPAAQSIAALEQRILSTGAKAIFMESGANPDLAAQIAGDTGIDVITGLYTHSLSERTGPAPTYLDMMRFNVTTILDALQGK